MVRIMGYRLSSIPGVPWSEDRGCYMSSSATCYRDRAQPWPYKRSLPNLCLWCASVQVAIHHVCAPIIPQGFSKGHAGIPGFCRRGGRGASSRGAAVMQQGAQVGAQVVEAQHCCAPTALPCAFSSTENLSWSIVSRALCPGVGMGRLYQGDILDGVAYQVRQAVGIAMTVGVRRVKGPGGAPAAPAAASTGMWG